MVCVCLYFILDFITLQSWLLYPLLLHFLLIIRVEGVQEKNQTMPKGVGGGRRNQSHGGEGGGRGANHVGGRREGTNQL